MPRFIATMRVVHTEVWGVEAHDIDGARRKFQLCTEDVIDDDSGGDVVDWEVVSVQLSPQETDNG